MARSITPFLMFDGAAEDAMNFYVSLFKGSEISHIDRYGPGEQGKDGSVKTANCVLAGQQLMCIDSPVKHDFSFTPSTSLFVNCEDEHELREAFGQLSSGGSVLMPLDNYGFSKQFGWLNDRYGVSWQLNLE